MSDYIHTHVSLPTTSLILQFDIAFKTYMFQMSGVSVYFSLCVINVVLGQTNHWALISCAGIETYDCLVTYSKHWKISKQASTLRHRFVEETTYQSVTLNINVMSQRTS